MRIFLLAAFVISISCGYYLPLPILAILSFLIYKLCGDKSRGNYGAGGLANIFSAAFDFFLIINLILMWLVAIAVRWELISHIFKEYVFR